DVFRFLVVQVSELRLCRRMATQKLIELGVDGLRVAIGRSLDEQGDQERGDGRNGMPVESIGVHPPPEEGIADNNAKRSRMRRIFAKLSEVVFQPVHLVSSGRGRPAAVMARALTAA